MSLDSAIKEIRNILKNEGIIEMDSINHCLIFLLAKFLNEESCQKFNIPKQYAFENIQLDEKGDELNNQDLYLKFYTPNSKDCLIHFINNKIGFTNTIFKLTQINNLANIFKALKNINIKNSPNVNISQIN